MSTYEEASEEADKDKRCLIIKYILFFAVGLGFLYFFGFIYLLSVRCFKILKYF